MSTRNRAQWRRRSPDDIKGLIDGLAEIPMLVNLIVLDALAYHDYRREIPERVALRHYLESFEHHLRGCTERSETMHRAFTERIEHADRSIDAFIDGIDVAALTTAPFDPRGFFVYSLRAADDAPLYIGQSTNVLARVGSHLGSAPFKTMIASVTLLRCRTHRIMDETEGRLIARHQPPWNVHGKG